MRGTPPVVPLHERRDLTIAIEALLWTPPVPLVDFRHEVPGAYALVYVGDLPIYRRLRPTGPAAGCRPVAVTGGSPIYLGKARDLRVRISEHRAKLTTCVDLDVDDFRVIALPTVSDAAARYIEATLIDAYKPVWNEIWLSGFGSKPQGQSRTRHQRAPRWSVLHPRRYATDTAAHVDERRDLCGRVRRHIATAVSDAYAIDRDCGHASG